MKNLILNTDSYKCSMWNQYPPGTKYVSSYVESRGGKFDSTLFFGLQVFIKETLLTPITKTDIDIAESIITAHGEPFNREGWEYILNEYNGFLPLRIQAVKEGTIVPTGNVLVQVINTDPKCYWLTTYIETALLRAIWYPTTVATLSKACKNIIQSFMNETSDNTDVSFKLHDFGARGVSSRESAELGGAAHLVNFMGTDTISGITCAMKNYNSGVCAYSIPAAEHSTITSWTRDNEKEAYENMLNLFSGENKIVAVVSDSYDLWNAIENIWGTELKDRIVNSGGTLVVRPDSGDPVQTVALSLIKLMEKFGYEVNSKGYKVLPKYIRLIQGDGINIESIEDILVELRSLKISAENLAFGMGGKLLQGVDRDTQKFAMKCSSIMVGNEWRDVYKDPITDSGKKSKKGRLMLIKDDSGKNFITLRENFNEYPNLLETVYENGKLIREQSFDEIRELSNKG